VWANLCAFGRIANEGADGSVNARRYGFRGGRR
jgi:hypothetical protein